MDLLETFCSDAGLSIMRETDDIEYTCDDSDFVIIDGEEGDYGILKYSDMSGKLLAVTTVEGGDKESTEFTEYGKKILSKIAHEILNKNIERFVWMVKS